MDDTSEATTMTMSTLGSSVDNPCIFVLMVPPPGVRTTCAEFMDAAKLYEISNDECGMAGLAKLYCCSLSL